MLGLKMRKIRKPIKGDITNYICTYEANFYMEIRNAFLESRERKLLKAVNNCYYMSLEEMEIKEAKIDK